MAPNDLTLNLTSDTGGASRRNTLRHHLLALTLLPLLGVLPLLGLILLLWGNNAIDRLLIGKVRSDLAVAQGYFERVQAEVGCWKGSGKGCASTSCACCLRTRSNRAAAPTPR